MHPDTVVERSHRPGLARWKRWLSLRAYGVVTSTLFGARTPPHKMRRRFERFSAVSRTAMQRKHPKLAFADHAVGPLAIESIAAVERPRCAVVYLHGGAFVMGSPASYRNRAMRLSYRCGAEVFVPDYRLAPEHRFPAALDDALVAWQYVKALRPELPILVAGDSAGGGLALSLILRLRQLGHARPDGAILLSPWTDLSASGASMDENHHKDLWLSRDHVSHWARHYVGAGDERNPLASPVFADLSGLPPLLVLAGEHEVLLDDARRVVEGARRAGTDAELLVGRDMQHDWPLTLPWLDESRHAWRAMVSFVDDAAGGRRGSSTRS
jgi:monoterpene epsilon-lactone hydrolase